MRKVIFISLLFCIGGVVVGCEKNYSVEEFKKDKKLFQEWEKKCEKMTPSAREKSPNCQNIVQADMELLQYYKNIGKKLRERIKRENETKTRAR